MKRSSILVNLLLSGCLLLPTLARAQSPQQDAEAAALRAEREAIRQEMQALRAERQALRADEREEMRAELAAARAELADAARRLAQTQRRLIESDGAGRHMQIETDEDGKSIRIIVEDAADREFDSATPQLGILVRSLRDSSEVLGLTPGGGAERAGLKRGDLVLSVNGRALNEQVSIPDALEGVDSGTTVPVIVSRDGQERRFDVETSAPERDIRVFARRFAGGSDFDFDINIKGLKEGLGGREFDFSELEENLERMEREIVLMHGEKGEGPHAGMSSMPGLVALGAGVELASNHAGLEPYFGTGNGVLVLRVAADNPLGLEDGDIILRVGDSDLERPVDLGRAVLEQDPGATLTLQIMRRGAREELRARVPEMPLSSASH